MRTDEEIKDDVIDILLSANVESEVSGRIYAEGERPLNSTLEDIIVSTLATNNALYQETFVNVNVYIADLKRDVDTVRNRRRIKELSKLLTTLFHNRATGDYRIEVISDKAYKVENTKEHALNIRLLITHINVDYYGVKTKNQ